MSDSIDSLRSQMRSEKDPRARYKLAVQVIALRRQAEASGHAAPAPPVKPIQRQDPIAAYTAAKARILQKGGTPSDSSPAQPPARKHTLGVRDWQTEPPAHMRQAVADAQRHQ
tara:strand:- start:138 stop:476 length:339 start_codon:yes stop_codon:yes gene_type:complete